MDLAFDWDQVKAFARQADGSLFSWCERHHCYHHLIHGIVSILLIPELLFLSMRILFLGAYFAVCLTFWLIWTRYCLLVLRIINYGLLSVLNLSFHISDDHSAF